MRSFTFAKRAKSLLIAASFAATCMFPMMVEAKVQTPARSQIWTSTGTAHYHPGVMERVARVRGLPQVRCMIVAVGYPVGTWVRLYAHNTGKTLTCRVTDVRRAKDNLLRRNKNVGVEVAFKNLWDACGWRTYGADLPKHCQTTIVAVLE